MTLRSRPMALRRAMTPAQEAANQRSFRIFRLRGLWHQCWLLTGENRTEAQAAIDLELLAMGAVAESERHRLQREALKREIASDEESEDPFAEIPF